MSRFTPMYRAALAVGLLLCATSSLWADYAAIAYSSSTGKYGYSYGYSSRARAENAALNNCSGDDAVIVVWVENGYAALALGDERGAYGTGWSTRSRADAEATALANARERTSGAYIARWVFSGR